MWTAALLGLLQGLTEFLPVSSSGHLVAARALVGAQAPGAALEVWLHLGTLVPVVAVYRQSLGAILAALLGAGDGRGRRALLALVLGSLPAAAVGLGARSALEAAFASPDAAAVGLVATTLALTSLAFVAPTRPGPARAAGLGPAAVPAVPGVPAVPALLIGCAQALALTPGLSRSGATIVAGRWLGLGAEDAAAFSFLLSIPAVLGAAVVEGLGHGASALAPLQAAAGFAAAATSGGAALWAVRRLLARGRLACFAPYTLALAVAVLWRL